MSFLSDSLKDAKEVVTLNKFWLAGMVVWGFIIAYILSVSSFGTDCTALSDIAIVGFSIGVAVSFVDYLLELLQDLSYFCSDDEPENDQEAGKPKPKSRYDHHLGVPSWWRGIFNVPRKFTGCYWLYLQNDICCRGRRAEPFFAFLLEALIRLAGNIALFLLVVLASLYSSMKSAQQGGQRCVDYFSTNVVLIDINILFWVTLALTGVRALLAFSYPDREEDISRKPTARPKKPKKHHHHHHHHHHHRAPLPGLKRVHDSSTTTSSTTDSDSESSDDETGETTDQTTTNTTEQTSINMDGNEKPLERPRKTKKASKPSDMPADEKPAEKTKDKPTPEAKTVEQQAHS